MKMGYRDISMYGRVALVFKGGRMGICEYPPDLEFLLKNAILINEATKYLEFFMGYLPNLEYLKYDLKNEVTIIKVNGEKTVVKLQKGDAWNYEIGALYAYVKHIKKMWIIKRKFIESSNNFLFNNYAYHIPNGFLNKYIDTYV